MNDEFQNLGDEYNVMLDRLKELIEKNKELSELRTIIEVETKTSKYVAKMIAYVQENYAKKISIHDLVEEIGLSDYKYFIRASSKNTPTSRQASIRNISRTIDSTHPCWE